jgi:hypothetical protein
MCNAKSFSNVIFMDLCKSCKHIESVHAWY